jgi:phosphate-selective porin OprO/OprP
MVKFLRRCLVLALTVSFVLGSAAWGQYTREEVMRKRLEQLENEVAKLRRSFGTPQQGLSRQQVQDLVRQELEEVQGDYTFRVYWDKGLKLKTMDGNFALKIGGRVMLDYAAISADDELASVIGSSDFEDHVQDGTEFRRARMFMSGSVYGNTGYKLQIDFADNEVTLKDAYLAIKELLPWSIKIGQFKEPFSLEELTSSKYITFMERAMPVSMAPSRNVGIQVSDHAMDKRMTWAIGAFWDADDSAETNTEEGAAITGRITGLPVYGQDGAQLVHVGAGASLRSPEEAQYKFRPNIHQAEKLLETMKVATDSVLLVGLEAAWVSGPFSVQGEYIQADIEGDTGDPDVDVDGYYVFASYFLTGEHRPYKTSAGSFSRVKPINNFNPDEGGWGAWEAAARYDHVEGDVASTAEMDAITLALNWYLNPNMRIMWNYVNSTLEYSSLDADTDAFMMRFQVDF